MWVGKKGIKKLIYQINEFANISLLGDSFNFCTWKKKRLQFSKNTWDSGLGWFFWWNLLFKINYDSNGWDLSLTKYKKAWKKPPFTFSSAAEYQISSAEVKLLWSNWCCPCQVTILLSNSNCLDCSTRALVVTTFVIQP